MCLRATYVCGKQVRLGTWLHTWLPTWMYDWMYGREQVTGVLGTCMYVGTYIGMYTVRYD